MLEIMFAVAGGIILAVFILALLPTIFKSIGYIVLAVLGFGILWLLFYLLGSEGMSILMTLVLCAIWLFFSFAGASLIFHGARYASRGAFPVDPAGKEPPIKEHPISFIIGGLMVFSWVNFLAYVMTDGFWGVGELLGLPLI